jgi:Protein of unknown function (DUF2694)
LTDDHSVVTGDQSYTASTPDGAVFVRVAVRGNVLGVQLEPEVMRRPGHEIAERIIACADVAYLQGQLTVRAQWEQANIDPGCFADMPTQRELDAAVVRLGGL